jgi:hypothetical protein
MSPVFVRDPRQRFMYALWEGSGSGSNALRVARAPMFGRTFSPPVAIVDKPGSFFAGFATLAAAPNGDVYAAWLDGRGGRAQNDTYDVMIARSTDHGEHFGPNAIVAHGACPCCRPAFAFDPVSGVAYLAWRQDFRGDYRDVVVARSNDGGKRWSAPARVSADGWSLRGCPHSGPSLAVQNGVLYVVWHTMGSDTRARVLAASSSDGEHFSTPEIISKDIDDADHPRLASGSADFPVVVFSGREGKKAGFGPVRAFVSAFRENRWRQPQHVPDGGRRVRDIVAAMRDGRTLYAAETLDGDSGNFVALVRARIR